MTYYYGTSGSDYHHTTSSENVFHMYGGNDSIFVSPTTQPTWFYGGDGNDQFRGSNGNDNAYGGSDIDNLAGGSGNDYLRGEAGHDSLWGDAGDDTLIGDAGNDRLTGDTGQDKLYGGTQSGLDFFQFKIGDSNAVAGQHDIIFDWNRYYDTIDSGIKGMPNNYTEASTGALSITTARGQVENSSVLRNYDHVYLYNSQTDTGYLLSDLNTDYRFETAIEIRGGGSASDMAWNDII